MSNDDQWLKLEKEVDRGSIFDEGRAEVKRPAPVSAGGPVVMVSEVLDREINESKLNRLDRDSRPESAALRAASLKKSYRRRCVVNDVSIEVHPGEIVGLLGPNGAGK